MDRRDFLKFIGVASSATILTSCGVEKSTEKLIPYVIPPEDPDFLPGEAMYRSSVCTECPANCGVSVKLVDFNPIKLEGLAEHPRNAGALCLRGQASLMRLYHPQRIRKPLLRKTQTTMMEKMSGSAFEEISWERALEIVKEEMSKAAQAGRKNVYLSGRTTGSLATLIDQFSSNSNVERLPEYELFAHANLRRANQTLFNRSEIPGYRIAEADFLLSIGADIIETFVNPVGYAVQLQEAREKNHLSWTHVEPHASLTGFQADQRLTVKPGSESVLLAFLLNYILGSNMARNTLPRDLVESLPRPSTEQLSKTTGLSAERIDELTESLARATRPLLIIGGVSVMQENGLSAALLAGLIQWASGMIGNTVDFSRAENYDRVGTLADMAGLAGRLQSNEVGVVMISRTDPVATLPAEMKFSDALKGASLRVALTDLLTATAEQCDLILPLSHGLESWGDTETRRGLRSFMKPVLKETLFGTMSEGDVLLSLMSGSLNGGQSYADWLKAQWTGRYGAQKVDQLLEAGFVEEPAASVQVSLKSAEARRFLQENQTTQPAEGMTLYAVPSLRTFDGRSSVLPLSHEIPDPLTTVSYGAWVSTPVANARDLGIPEKTLVKKDREVLEIKSAAGAVKLPNAVQPGLPRDVFTVQLDLIDRSLLSYNRRSGELLAMTAGISVANTGARKGLAILAGDIRQGKRPIIPEGEGEAHHQDYLKGDETLYPDPYKKYPDYRWAISIDMESCTGCSACVAACHMENNIPCVGEREHLTGREMSWIRLEPFYNDAGGMDNLVMLCQQCDFAPCENVCPVYATYHNEEGLNVMVYNRCVGTRYCHNNCPYKVRRFNWFDWTDEGAWQEPLSRMLNPEVWTRPKGVMEKCTFCVQRIRKAKDKAKDEGRKVLDGEVVPACAQTCPTNAITFGNILDKNSAVYQKAQSDRKFRVLETLGTGPAVHYLRKEEQV